MSNWKSVNRLLLAPVLIVAVLITNSCTTDFDVNAEWKDITIVYGLLNQNDDVHMIKINKAFLGPDDAAVMAQVQDSSEYANIQAYIERWRDGNKLATYTLQDTIITNKDTGFFYAPEQTVYYFSEPNLDKDSKYKLIIKFDEGGANEKIVTSETELINGEELVVNLPPLGITLGFATIAEYSSSDFKFNAVVDGKRYQLTIVFPYENELVGGSKVMDSVVINYPVVTTAKTDGFETIKIGLQGEDFYQAVQSQVKDLADEPNVIQRRPIYEIVSPENKWGVVARFYISVACDELNTYIEVNSPTTGIVQEKPQYSNLDNGLGIFSCRYKFIGKRRITTESMNELLTGAIGGYTTAKGFCDPTGNVNTPGNLCQ